jgi:P-type Cu2+ transporter
MTVAALIALKAQDTTPLATQAALQSLTLAVENMHCGGCLRSVERAALGIAGVASARANLSAKRVSIAYDPARTGELALIEALARAGFPAAPMQSAKPGAEQDRQNYLLRRMAVAGFAAMNIMLLSVSVWAGRAEDMDQSQQILFWWISALIALPTVTYAGQPFFASALIALRGRRLNMDVPISLAILLATAMSLYQTIRGNDQVYFDAAVSLLFFLLVGRLLDEALRVRARGQAQNLVSLQSGIATVIAEDGCTRHVPAHALGPADRLLVATGERVLADGIVSSGEGEVDQSLITGETMPAKVKAGDTIYAGTVNLLQPLTIEVTAAADTTLLAEIGRLMLAAEQGKARYRRLADRAAQIYAPAVHGLGLATFLGWMLLGAPWQTGLTYAIAVLIVTCPCALALAVPAVQVAATSRLFRQGVVVKSADGLERVAEADLVVFDKTGTLTRGRPELLYAERISDAALLRAGLLAQASKHPYAQAIVSAAKARGKLPPPAKDVEEVPGSGLRRRHVNGEERLGSAEWCGVRNEGSQSEAWYCRDPDTPIAFRFADASRSDTAGVIESLRRRGLSVVLLSGDRRAPVEAIARATGISEWKAELTPSAKIACLSALAERGRKVLMVGDGLNDAPALAAAHTSISPASATDITQRTADFVFQGEELAPVVEIIDTARRARSMALQNFGVAFIYNIISVPFAMAGYVTPLIAAIAMSTSSILVTLNATRLSWRKLL